MGTSKENNALTFAVEVALRDIRQRTGRALLEVADFMGDMIDDQDCRVVQVRELASELIEQDL